MRAFLRKRKINIILVCVCYLVGVVGLDVVERGGSRLAEQCGGGGAMRPCHGDVLGVRDGVRVDIGGVRVDIGGVRVGIGGVRVDIGGVRLREDGRRAGRGGGGGREAGQALRQAVHVDLDLRVVEVLLAVAVVRVAAAPVRGRSHNLELYFYVARQFLLFVSSKI